MAHIQPTGDKWMCPCATSENWLERAVVCFLHLFPAHWNIKYVAGAHVAALEFEWKP